MDRNWSSLSVWHKFETKKPVRAPLGRNSQGEGGVSFRTHSVDGYYQTIVIILPQEVKHDSDSAYINVFIL